MPTGYRGGANNPELSASWLIKDPQGVIGGVARAVCLKALRYHDGVVSYAARDLKIARSTLVRWISSDEALKAGLDVIREEVRLAQEREAARQLEPD